MTTTQSSPVVTGDAAARITLQTLREMKRRQEPISMLTAYDYPTARILASAGIEILLVGDSVATTVLGFDSTVAATMELLLALTGAVRRAAPGCFVMGDMPFASYPDVPTAAANAARFVREAGADAVKIEADGHHREIVAALSAAGVCVCAHLGLLPQRAPQQGGYVAQGRTPADARRIIEEAMQLAQAGAQLLLLEAIPDEVTAELQKQLARAQLEAPVLGCGAGPSADGHVVVSYDMLGYSERTPRFVERFGDVPAAVRDAARRYREAIKSRAYPAARHQYRMKASTDAGVIGG